MTCPVRPRSARAAPDQADYEHMWLIHSQTGEIVYWSAETGIDGHTKVDPTPSTRN